MLVCSWPLQVSGTSGSLVRRKLFIMISMLYFVLGGSFSEAKEVGATGVWLYMSPSGPRYVQLTDLLVNGKAELRGCPTAPMIDKNNYKNLPKLALSGVAFIDRESDGTLTATLADGTHQCVLPGNYKFTKDGPMSASDLVDKSLFTAQVIASRPTGTTALPGLTAGSRIALVAPNDVELADYLLASWANTITQFNDYLSGHRTGSHAPAARKSLETLLVQDGTKELTAYASVKKSAGGAAPEPTHLKAARERADEAFAVDPAVSSALEFQQAVRAELVVLADAGDASLAKYSAALAGHTEGYASLVRAKAFSESAYAADPKFPRCASLHTKVIVEFDAYELDLKEAQRATSEEKFDQAYQQVHRYVSFQNEDARLKSVVDAAAHAHMNQGTEFTAENRWAEAIAEFQRANDYAPSELTSAALARANAGLIAATNKAAADAAVAHSKSYAADKDFIRSYEVLSNLPPDQRTLVKTQLADAQPAFISAATDRASRLQQAHPKVSGRAGEDDLREAYNYLKVVDGMTDNPDVQVRLDLLSDQLGEYYLGLAKKFLDKPVASGTGVGWAYLTEASEYKPGWDKIRDEVAKASTTYQMRSKLSIGVVFRDQTSRRESIGFAEQLQDSLATGLETSKLPVRVIRPGTVTGLDPNFQLVGEILQHRTIRTVTNDTLKSNYRSGEREVPNPEWNRADTAYQDALAKLEAANSALHVAQGRNDKKGQEAATPLVAAAQAVMLETRSKVNLTPKSLQEDVIRPYNYTRQVIDLTFSLELSFRIVDTSGNTIVESTHIVREVPKKFTILENIKPDDTEGVREKDARPDEAQLMTDVEIGARDELVKLVYDRVAGLPNKICTIARSRLKAEDLDGAAEFYILYLNSTTDTETPERTEAIRFLNQNYNLRHSKSLSATVQ